MPHFLLMRLAIVDDEALARARLERLLGAMDDVELVGSCDSAATLLELLRKQAVDALLLDIRMPGIDGMELAELVRERQLGVVFVTAHPEHAVRAFAVGAVDYLLKPVEAGRLREAVVRLQRQRGATARERLAVETASGVVLVPPDSITHASFDGLLVTIHLSAGAQLRQVHTIWSLAALQERLPAGLLERVHRRALLNLDHVERLERNDSGGYIAWLAGGAQVEISRQEGRRLRRRFGW